MKRTTGLITVITLSFCCMQVLLPAKQSVKAYKTGLKDETWTVAVFTNEHDKTPFSKTSFKSTSSILPGRGLYFNFDGNITTNYVKVYPTKASDASVCMGNQNNNGCGVVNTLAVNKQTTLPGSVIRIEVRKADDYDIKIDPPKKDTVEIEVKRDCDIGESCDAPWTVAIHNERNEPTGFTAQVGDDKPAKKIRVPANKPFWVHVKAGSSDSSEIWGKKIEFFGKKLTKKNVLLVSRDMVTVATQGDTTDQLFGAVKKKNNDVGQHREFQQFGGF